MKVLKTMIIAMIAFSGVLAFAENEAASTPTGISDDKSLILTFQEIDPGYITKWFGISPRFYLEIEVYRVGSQHLFAVADREIETVDLGRFAEKTSLSNRQLVIPMKEINAALAKTDEALVTEDGEYEKRGIRFKFYHAKLGFDEFLQKDSLNFPTSTAIRECSYCRFLSDQEQEVFIRDDEESLKLLDDQHDYSSLKFTVKAQ